MLIWLWGCEGPPATDSEAEDTDPGSSLGCHQEEVPDGLPVAGIEESSVLSRVARIPSDSLGEAAVVVFFPPIETPGLWDEGAAVTVSASPPQADAVSYYPAGAGIVDVQPLYPGRSWGEVEAPGDYDELGGNSALAVADAIRFALGEVQTVDGLTLSQLAERAVCDAGIVLLGTSGGGGPALAALGQLDEERARIHGLVNFESATNPPLMAGDAGRVWADPDDTVDADGDGYGWDDTRNRGVGSCDGEHCDIDLSQLAWDPDLVLDELYDPFYFPSDPGALYLERTGNGRLDLVDDSPDIDADGAIGDDEDLPLTPHHGDFEHDGVLRHYYSPDVLQAAVDRGLLAEPTWPTHVATPAMTEAYWADRSLLAQLPDPEGFAGTRFVSVFTAGDHGVPLPERPHVRQLYEGLAERGWEVAYNDVAYGARCLDQEGMLGDWDGPPETGAELGPADMQAAALPDDADPLARAFAVLGLHAAALGEFDHCYAP